MFTFPDHIGEVAVYEKMVKKHFGKFIEGNMFRLYFCKSIFIVIYIYMI